MASVFDRQIYISALLQLVERDDLGEYLERYNWLVGRTIEEALDKVDTTSIRQYLFNREMDERRGMA